MTNTPEGQEERGERFDEEFKFTLYDGSPDEYNPTAKAIKAFIEQEIALAEEAMRQRCVAAVKNSRTFDEFYGVGVKEETARMQAVVALCALADKPKEV